MCNVCMHARMYVCMCVCVYVCMSVCLSVCLSACLPACLSVCLSVCVRLSVLIYRSIVMLCLSVTGMLFLLARCSRTIAFDSSTCKGPQGPSLVKAPKGHPSNPMRTTQHIRSMRIVMSPFRTFIGIHTRASTRLSRGSRDFQSAPQDAS